jgi:broad specificity phosphatase PhoE
MLIHTPFYFIRHGETDWNKLKLMQGQTDTPLNPNGIVQAQAAAELISTRKVVTICHSPLRRAKHTAELIAEKSQARAMVPVVGLMECNFGIYEGHPSGSWYDGWRAGDDLPNGETYRAFLERSLRAINESLSHPGPVLIVAHGGTFSAVRRWALDDTAQATANGQLLALSPPHKTAKRWTVKHISAPDFQNADFEESLLPSL